MRFTHRRLSKVPMAWPASSTWRQSCRRISLPRPRPHGLRPLPVARPGSMRRDDPAGQVGQPARRRRLTPAATDMNVVKTIRSRAAGTKLGPLAQITSPRTRSGWRFHRSCGHRAAHRVADGDHRAASPSSSSRAATSSAQSARRKRRRERMPRPWPRRSGATTRKCSLSGWKTWNQLRPAAGHPAVQQQDGGRSRRTRHLPDERGAPAPQPDPPAERHGQPGHLRGQARDLRRDLLGADRGDQRVKGFRFDDGAQLRRAT